MPSPEAPPSAESPSLAQLFSRLPLEVLGLIVEQTAKLCFTRKEVAALCLVAKAFLPRVQRELYHSVSTSYCRCETDDDGEPIEPPEVLEIDDVTLRRTLAEAPHLRAYVRRLAVHLGFNNYTVEDAQQVRPALQAIFTACPNIMELIVGAYDTAAPADAAAAIAQLGRSLPVEELEIWYGGEGTDALLKQLPMLRKLTTIVTNPHLAPSHPRSFPFSLTDLRIEQYCPGLFQSLTFNSFSTLCTLPIDSDILVEGVVQQGFHAFVALRDLAVFVTSEDTHHSHLTASAISSLRALDKLTLHGNGNSFGDLVSHPLATDLLPRLPISLRTLDLRYISTHPSSLIQLFNHRSITPPPNLEIIRLPREVKRALEGTDEEQRLWWETAVECCGKAGVRVFA